MGKSFLSIIKLHLCSIPQKIEKNQRKILFYNHSFMKEIKHLPLFLLMFPGTSAPLPHFPCAFFPPSSECKEPLPQTGCRQKHLLSEQNTWIRLPCGYLKRWKCLYNHSIIPRIYRYKESFSYNSYIFYNHRFITLKEKNKKEMIFLQIFDILL